MLAQVHLDRLVRIVDASLPAGSSDARTLGIALLFDILGELRGIRSALEGEPVQDEPATVDPEQLLAGRSSDVCRAVAACDDAGALARCLELETAKKRPRSTVVSAIRSRLQALA